MKITFNGVDYESLEAMPPEVRIEFEKVMTLARDAREGRSTGSTAVYLDSQIVINGVTYRNESEVPADLRAALHQARGAAKGQNTPFYQGSSGMMEGEPAFQMNFSVGDIRTQPLWKTVLKSAIIILVLLGLFILIVLAIYFRKPILH